MILDEHACLINEQGLAQRFELKTGKDLWQKQRATSATWSSLVAAGDRLYVITQDGETVVLSAGPEFKVLARNATGQKFSTYVGMISGPSRSADIELTLTTGVHGPKEVHVVLLDNGRLAARDDPDLREALHCIKCGACANVCPPYSVVGGHAFGHIYTGPIGLVLTELVINVAKYAYEGAPGPVKVGFGRSNDEIVLTVADQGRGRPAEAMPAKGGGFGTRMMMALVQQLGGSLSYADNNPGARATLTAPA